MGITLKCTNNQLTGTVRTLKNTDDLSVVTKSSRLIANALAIEVICGIFGLRSLFRSALSMMAIPAHHLPVINDSEAFSYSGQNEKVPGLVFAALISRLRIVQGSLTLAARKNIRLLMAALGLILTATHSQAGLGWTLAQFEQQYGKPVIDQEQIAGRTGYVFSANDYIIAAFLRNTQVSRILYICRGGSVLDWERARALLAANAPETTWDNASKKEADNFYRVNGTKDGVESYYASLSNDGKMLAIWTKEDDEAGRPKLDTPPVSSVVESNGKSAGEGIAAHPPGIESESTPKINRPDVTANPTSSSPATTTSSSPATATSSSPATTTSSSPATATSSSPATTTSSSPATTTSSSPATTTSSSPATAISSSPATTTSSSPATTTSSSPANTTPSSPPSAISSSPPNMTSSSRAQRAAPRHASHTKIARAKHRAPLSSHQNFRVANFDAKARSAPSPHQNVGSAPANSTPNSPHLMNAGTELYNSDYTQPFKNAKKAP
jgi:hypothetical protein